MKHVRYLLIVLSGDSLTFIDVRFLVTSESKQS